MVPRDELRGVEAVVRLPEELERCDAVVRQRSPAERHVQVLSREALPQTRAERRRVVSAGVCQQRELVTTDPRELVVRAETAPESIGQASELVVARRVAVGVVHRLEAVHVAEQQDEGLALGAPAC